MAKGHTNQFELTGEVISVGNYSDQGKTPFQGFQLGVEVNADGDHLVKFTPWIDAFGAAANYAADEKIKVGDRVRVVGRIGAKFSEAKGWSTQFAVQSDEGITFLDDRDVDSYPEKADKESGEKDSGRGGGRGSRSSNGGGNGGGGGAREGGSRGGGRESGGRGRSNDRGEGRDEGAGREGGRQRRSGGR